MNNDFNIVASTTAEMPTVGGVQPIGSMFAAAMNGTSNDPVIAPEATGSSFNMC